MLWGCAIMIALSAQFNLSQSNIAYADVTSGYTVTFDSQGGSAVADQTNVAFGNPLESPTDPTKTGNTFGGWYMDQYCSTVWDFSSDTMPDNDITLYAKWTVNMYTVTYDTQGGSTGIFQTTTMYGLGIMAPATPTKAGSTFSGWYTDKDCTVPWDYWSFTMPDHDITLYVKWTVNQYDVTFDSQGGTDVDGIEDVAYDTTIASPVDPTKTGNTFGGWYIDKDCTVPWDFTNDKVTDDTTLYAKWILNKYNVTFDSQGGSKVNTESGIMANTTIDKPKDPTYKGHTFGGWYKDEECTIPWDFASDTMPDGDMTLYAKWTVTANTDPVVDHHKVESATHGSNLPQTGDTSNYMAIWIALIASLLALATIFGVWGTQRRRKNEK